MNVRENLTIVLQAGGESKRMGRSKATVPFLGEPLIWRGVRRLLPIASEFIITTNEPENLGFLGDLLESGKVRLVRDVDDVRGALHGVKTALTSAKLEYVAMVACDMVFPSANLIVAELDLIQRKGADAVIPQTKYGLEPFHGVYRREACLRATLEALEAGEVRATGWADKVNTIPFTRDMVDAAEPQGRCFINVNTPDALREVERTILQGKVPKE